MTKHLNEQPWYDYHQCLNATMQNDISNSRQIGEIFSVNVASVKMMSDFKLNTPVTHFFWALKISNVGENSDRYRMCLNKEPLQAQRVLRGIEEPRLASPMSNQVYRPSALAKIYNIIP